MATIVTSDDMATYLGITALSDTDEDRVDMLIDDAIAQALAIVTVGTVPDTGPTEANLPTGAASVIRAAVARIFLNPTGVTAEAVGVVNYSRPAGTGSLFSTAERGALRRMGNGSEAFSVDLLAGYPTSVFPTTS